MDRRSFFTRGLNDLLSSLLRSPVGKIIDRQLQGVANLLAPQKLSFPTPRSAALRKEIYARPPGALLQADLFDSACTRCGDCIRACPYEAILDGGAAGPLLDPDTVPCHLCPDLPCQQACGEGALLPLPQDSLPAFGKAELLPFACLNYGSESQDCRQCLDACPVEGALRLNADALPRFGSLCTGCGLCKASCPARPVAIQIKTGSTPC